MDNPIVDTALMNLFFFFGQIISIVHFWPLKLSKLEPYIWLT